MASRFPSPRALLTHLALSALLLASGGCLSVGTKEVKPEQVVQAARESALTHGRASERTVRLLRLTLLEELAEEAPERALRSLLAVQERGDGPWGSTEGMAGAAELAMLAGRRLEGEDPRTACGYFLAAAELALVPALGALRGEVSPLDPQARFAAELYNFSVGRVARLLHGPLALGEGEGEIWLDGPFGTYHLEPAGDRIPWDARTFRLQPADEIVVQGLENRHRAHGLGAPLVVRLQESVAPPSPEDGLIFAYRGFYGLTAVLRFEAAEVREGGRHRRASLAFHDPLADPATDVEGFSVPLEADFTAPLAALNESTASRGTGTVAALRSADHMDETGLMLLEPYREDKIPVILVHGLQSTAATWIKMANGLRADPEIRRRYQLWAFNYPTGVPFTLSAAILHENLERGVESLDPERKNPQLDRAVIVGHSMGGLVARLQVTRSGDRFWQALSSLDFEDLDISQTDRDLLQRTLFVEPVPWISRAIFMATPHRGSRLAGGGLARLVSSLVEIPSELAESYARLQEAGALPSFDRRPEDARRIPTVVESLRPENPVLQTLVDLPPAVPFHTVIADWPLGGQKGPVSDGVVDGESASIPDAVSELTVRCGHAVHQHPEGIAEVRRILKQHLRQVDGDP